jgi:hypothetical protein
MPTKRREAEEAVKEEHHDQRHADGAQLVRREPLSEHRLPRERARKALDGVAVDPARHAVQDHEQRDEDHHHGEHRGILHRPDDEPLDQHAEHEREKHRRGEGDPVRRASLDEAPRDIGAEHRHLALGEIHEVGRLVDHHQREREARVDAAGGESRQDLVKERFLKEGSLK